MAEEGVGIPEVFLNDCVWLVGSSCRLFLFESPEPNMEEGFTMGERDIGLVVEEVTAEWSCLLSSIDLHISAARRLRASAYRVKTSHT
jgi:hypothetical protein